MIKNKNKIKIKIEQMCSLFPILVSNRLLASHNTFLFLKVQKL